jgi:hypothetical protein
VAARSTQNPIAASEKKMKKGVTRLKTRVSGSI